MKRKAFLSIEDILEIKPSKITQYCNHTRRCCASTRLRSTVDHTEGHRPRSRSSANRAEDHPHSRSFSTAHHAEDHNLRLRSTADCKEDHLRSRSTTDDTEDFFPHTGCTSDRLTCSSWQSPYYYTGYSAPCYSRKQYWQQYYIAYGRYASQLYLRDHYSKQPKRRMRASFTHEQVLKLQKVFQSKKYLGNQERTELAQKLNMTEQQIKIWFQNRRYKEKKQLKSGERVQPLCSTWKSIHQEDFFSKEDNFESNALEAEDCIEIM